MLKIIVLLLVAPCVCCAGMSPADITATKAGISDALALFYTIGGAILVVCAAIWGFNKLSVMLGDYRYDHDSDK